MKLVRVSNYLKAAMLRAQCKTIKGASQMHYDLAKEEDGRYLSQFYTGDLRPPGWTEHAFCTSLHFAFKGLGLGFDSRANEIADVVQSLSVPGVAKSRKSTQAAFYELLQSFSNSDWDSTLRRKVAFISFPEGAPSPLNDWHFASDLQEQLFSMLRKLGVRGAMAVVKSWANAWTTSTRMHEPKRLTCIFGCDAEDSLDHYLRCDPLWTAVISNSFKRSELLWCCPTTKLGLISPSMEWLQMCVVAFSCYHSIKMTHMPEILHVLESGNPCQVHSHLMNYAKAHCNDLFKM